MATDKKTKGLNTSAASISPIVAGEEYLLSSWGNRNESCRIGGDAATSGGKFSPNVNISYPCGSSEEQFYINLNRKDVLSDKKADVLPSGEISLSIGDETDLFYLDASGRLKWDIVFAARPKKNVFDWELTCSPGISFHRINAPSESAIADGHKLFPGVEGDYLIYCDRSGDFIDDNEQLIVSYGIGKLGHLHKPIAIDANGVTVVCELEINPAAKRLRITIPGAFVDTCALPFRLDPTFGAPTSEPTSGSSTISGRLRGVGSTPASAGTADSVSIFLNGTFPTAGRLQCAVYTGAVGSNGALQGYTNELSGTGVGGWLTVNFASGPAITNSINHTAVVQCNGTSYETAYDAVNADLYYGSQVYSVNNWPNPYTDSKSNDAYRYGIYCTYTTGSAGKLPTGIARPVMNVFNRTLMEV